MAHVHEKIDYVADVFIVHKDKVLLRMHEKYHLWLAVGGHIELNEDPVEAALREVKEEVGLDVVIWEGNKLYTSVDEPHGHLTPPVAMNRHHTSPEHEHISLAYFAYSESDKVVPESPTDEWRWLTKDELQKLDILPDTRFLAGLAIDILKR